MGKLILWGHPGSINVQKVLWALDELNLVYERIDVGGKFGRTKDAEYLELNPNGLIPTLIDDGQALWESNAIVRYLFSAYGDAPLQPASAIERARADGWNEWFNSTLWPNVRVLNVQLLRTPEEKRDAALIEGAHKSTLATLARLDAELQKRPYLAGDSFTFADIPVGAALQRFYGLPLKQPELSALDAYYARLKQRPAFQRWVDAPKR